MIVWVGVSGGVSTIYVENMASREQMKQEAISQLCDILERARASGLSQEKIKKCLESEDLVSVPEIAANRPSRWKYIKCLSLHCIIFNVLPTMLLLTLMCLPVFELMKGSPCLVFKPGIIAELIHPLADCKFCANVTEAPRLQNISAYEFVSKYAYTLKPSLVVGAASEWPAVNLFSYDYFRKLYQQIPEAMDADMSSGQFFPYSSGIKDLKELLELPTERATMASERWYIGWSTSDPHIGEELQKHFSAPSFLPPGSSELSLAWIFMGAPGPGASIHIDSVDLPSWQAQLSGTKTWTLTPPPECEHICHRFNITVNKGDIIVVDTNSWYHETYIHPGNISITIGAEYR